MTISLVLHHFKKAEDFSKFKIESERDRVLDVLNNSFLL